MAKNKKPTDWKAIVQKVFPNALVRSGGLSHAPLEIVLCRGRGADNVVIYVDPPSGGALGRVDEEFHGVLVRGMKDVEFRFRDGVELRRTLLRLRAVILKNARAIVKACS